MSRIFISYRRADSAPYAGRLYDRLSQHFGDDKIFMDIDTLKLGVDFVEVIEDAVGSCDVLIALIGQQWLTVTDAKGQRRLDNPNDFVRLEIKTALERNIRVIPALLANVSMPRAQDLPDALKMLARRNGLEISDTRFHSDVNRLIRALEEILGVPKTAPKPPQPPQAPPPQQAVEQPPQQSTKSPKSGDATMLGGGVGAAIGGIMGLIIGAGIIGPGIGASIGTVIGAVIGVVFGYIISLRTRR